VGYQATQKGQLISADISGPYKPHTGQRHRFLLSFTGQRWGFLLRNRQLPDIINCYRDVVNEIQNHTGHAPQFFR